MFGFQNFVYYSEKEYTQRDSCHNIIVIMQRKRQDAQGQKLSRKIITISRQTGYHDGYIGLYIFVSHRRIALSLNNNH